MRIRGLLVCVLCAVGCSQHGGSSGTNECSQGGGCATGGAGPLAGWSDPIVIGEAFSTAMAPMAEPGGVGLLVTHRDDPRMLWLRPTVGRPPIQSWFLSQGPVTDRAVGDVDLDGWTDVFVARDYFGTPELVAITVTEDAFSFGEPVDDKIPAAFLPAAPQRQPLLVAHRASALELRGTAEPWLPVLDEVEAGGSIDAVWVAHVPRDHPLLVVQLDRFLELKLELYEIRDLTLVFVSQWIPPGDPSSASVVDVNGDTHSDVVLSSEAGLAIYEVDSDDEFVLRSEVPIPGRNPTAADLDGDGERELLLISPDDGISIVSAPEDPSMREVVHMVTEFETFRVEAVDLDLDDRVDLVAGGRWGVTVYYNDH